MKQIVLLMTVLLLVFTIPVFAGGSADVDENVPVVISTDVEYVENQVKGFIHHAVKEKSVKNGTWYNMQLYLTKSNTREILTLLAQYAKDGFVGVPYV